MKSPWIDQAQLVTVLGELAGMLEGRALLDVLQNLLIAGFVAHDEQPASGFLHRLERFVIGGDARSAGPGQAQRLQLGAQLDGARRLDIESIVVEEKLLHFRPVLLDLRHFSRHIVGGALAPRMSAQSLRPQAERALRRAAARGVERNVGMQQERHVVTRNVEIALVDVGDVRQRIQILNLRRVRIVHDLAILQERNAGNLFQRLALGVVDHGVVKLLAGNEIDRRTIAQRLLRQHADMRPHKSNLDLRIRRP